MRGISVLVVCSWAVACGGERPVAIPPGSLITPPDPPKKKAAVLMKSTLPTAPTPVNPITAAFVEKKKEKIDHAACETRALFVVKGKATIDGKDALAAGDAVITYGKGSFSYDVDTLAVLASAEPTTCDAAQLPPLTKKIIRGKDTPELQWNGGAMRARLDVEGNPVAYFGRLEGTSAVAEHAHDSWETLCAVEGEGSFTVAGQTQKLTAKTCVSVGPKISHSFTPEGKSKLIAVQMYAPPGPEQRFKTLASSGTGAPEGGLDGGKR